MQPPNEIPSPQSNPLNSYAVRLLHDLGATGTPPVATEVEHPARQLAESGLMALFPGTTPALFPVPFTECADGVLNAFRSLSGVEVLPGVRGSQLLTERMAITGDRSLDHHCRLLPTSDGSIALNLTRPEDWELLPAWLQIEQNPDWVTIGHQVQNRASEALLARGRLLGLAVADATQIPQGLNNWVKITPPSQAKRTRGPRPRVIDLSSLWAGPLCSHLWQSAGAEVIKVEGSRRPDGARTGSPAFFDLLNREKDCLSLDLHRDSGQQALRDLILGADIVLEASRPRALRQMGIFAEKLIEEKPGLTWVSITGYGRSEPEENWIAYGDDAGVAAGLSAIMHAVTGQWMVYGDAIADPLTGLHAALAGWAGWKSSGGLVELSLKGTVRHCITATAPPGNDYCARHRRWQVYLQSHNIAPSLPRPRSEARPSPRC